MSTEPCCEATPVDRLHSPSQPCAQGVKTGNSLGRYDAASSFPGTPPMTLTHVLFQFLLLSSPFPLLSPMSRDKKGRGMCAQCDIKNGEYKGKGEKRKNMGLPVSWQVSFPLTQGTLFSASYSICHDRLVISNSASIPDASSLERISDSRSTSLYVHILFMFNTFKLNLSFPHLPALPTAHFTSKTAHFGEWHCCPSDCPNQKPRKETSLTFLLRLLLLALVTKLSLVCLLQAPTIPALSLPYLLSKSHFPLMISVSLYFWSCTKRFLSLEFLDH